MSVHAVDVTNDDERFEVSLEVDHGDRVRAFIAIRSEPDGMLRITERLEALRSAKTREVATGMIGALNNPNWVYENGEREVKLGDEERTISSGKGTIFEAQGVEDVNIDGVIQIRASVPLDVVYRGARKAERARFTDELYLNYSTKTRTWQPGDVISEYEVAIQCAR